MTGVSSAIIGTALFARIAAVLVREATLLARGSQLGDLLGHVCFYLFIKTKFHRLTCS